MDIVHLLIICLSILDYFDRETAFLTAIVLVEPFVYCLPPTCKLTTFDCSDTMTWPGRGNLASLVLFLIVSSDWVIFYQDNRSAFWFSKHS